MFFVYWDKQQQTAQVDVKDEMGNTPLLKAVILGEKKGGQKTAGKGQIPNLANDDGVSVQRSGRPRASREKRIRAGPKRRLIIMKFFASTDTSRVSRSLKTTVAGTETRSSRRKRKR
ncbi:unnamed protein product [Trichogramma brassicae]|uniref:Uncharacterized protein n=1 Tax=Trichogramma brassicae TaxID=86971 RepID=A0A6H5I4U8_9HYME|nr:unnamed protein product [Trichogramma brassicae]